MWLKKLFCCHEWQISHITKYTTCDRVLLICKKCGKLKVKHDNSAGIN
jgi:hypothetical protein